MYELLDVETLEIVLDGLTLLEACELMEHYPNSYLIKNCSNAHIYG
jgi:hypothetical protein